MELDPRPNLESEATVLDLYKSATKDWASFFRFVSSAWSARRREEFNQSLGREAEQAEPLTEATTEKTVVGVKSAVPLKILSALLLALIGQLAVEPPNRFGFIAVVFYLAAFGLTMWSFRLGEWTLPSLPTSWRRADSLSFKLIPFVLAAGLGVFSFLDFGGNRFTWHNVTAWILSVALLCYSLWIKTPKENSDETAEAKWKKWAYLAALILVFAVGLSFRLYMLFGVPNEPFSDHAEKLLDVYGITHGNPYIFFERNTGREAFQMYWTLLILTIFKTGFTYNSLKLGTILIGIFTMPYVYLIGKEYGGKRAALFALLLFGIAYWPNVISRIGLRFPLYPMFFAPTFYYLIRGLRTQTRNDFIWAGLFLGVGLHGYSPFRVVPIFAALVVGAYILHARTRQDRKQALGWLLITALVSLFVFMPLLRYGIENPQAISYRAMTRLSGEEEPLPAPAAQIFFSNLYKGLLTFNWNNGGIWVHSVVFRPALDLISAALFALGVLLILLRYIRNRDWRDLTLLLSIPVLILPSVMSLAFPGENPSLNRTGAAAVTVILVAALALDGFVSSFGSEKRRQWLGWGIALFLVCGAMYFNYDLVFNQFAKQYREGAWNTSDMAKVIKDFENQYGEIDTAWIVPVAYWVDTRLPGDWLGLPEADFAKWPEELPQTLDIPAPKLFIYKDDDAQTGEILRELYPDGKLSLYTSPIPYRNFYVFLVEP
ncbi:MAG: glycosyltransferase family 39 protein [Anaerolineales bacterium]|nr:glycosyltransferase family 39 protein [Anaerolineales bacterium]